MTKNASSQNLALIEDTESKLRNYPPAYPYTDNCAKVCNHGDEWAEKWIIGSVELLSLPRRKEVSQGFLPDLPLRVVQGFKEWWELRKLSCNATGFHMKPQENGFCAKIM